MAWSIWLESSESGVNITNNTSVVTVSLCISWDYGSWAADNPSYNITIDGTAYSGTANFNTGGVSSGSQVVVSKSKTIQHNNDGSKSVGFSAWYDGSGSGRQSTSGSRTLTTIPRKASISSCSNVDIGSNCSIKWTPKASSHTFSLKFSLGSWSHTINNISSSNTNPYDDYTIPNEVMNQLPNAAQGTMSVTLTTYSGSSNIGSDSSSFTVYVPSTVIPTITSSSVSISRLPTGISLIDDNGWYVQGYSNAKISASASGKYGSTIIRYDVSDGKTNGYERTIMNSTLSHDMDTAFNVSGEIKFRIRAVDSRGRYSDIYIASGSNVINVLPYAVPSITSAAVKRAENPNTTKGIVNISYTFSPLPNSAGNLNTCRCILKYKKKSSSAWTTYTDPNTGSVVYISSGVQLITAENTFEINSSYDSKLVVYDLISDSVEYNSDMSTTDATVDFKAGGTSIALGKMAEYDNMFEVDWDTNLNQDLNVVGDTEIGGATSITGNTTLGGTLTLPNYSATPTNILDLIYPIGSIYMSVTSTNPQTIFGGIWERLKNCFLYGGYDESERTSDWTKVCDEDESFTVTDSSIVYRFGTGDKWVEKVFNVGTYTASVDTFGNDPAAGILKEVYKDTSKIIVGDSGGVEKYALSASIGAVNSSPSILGYITEGRNSYQAEQEPNYNVIGATHSSGGAWNHSTPVTVFNSSSRSTTNMPPYLAVYMWKRTA